MLISSWSQADLITAKNCNEGTHVIVECQHEGQGPRLNLTRDEAVKLRDAIVDCLLTIPEGQR